MYLTNPPCTEVDIEVMYVGREGVKSCLPGETAAENRHWISAVRRIHKETGVTFAALMEANCMRGMSADVLVSDDVGGREQHLLHDSEGVDPLLCFLAQWRRCDDPYAPRGQLDSGGPPAHGKHTEEPAKRSAEHVNVRDKDCIKLTCLENVTTSGVI